MDDLEKQGETPFWVTFLICSCEYEKNLLLDVDFNVIELRSKISKKLL